jgi:predicted helicase
MNDNATIYYHDIGDYLTREQKLARIKEFGSVGAMLKAGAFTILQPNKHGDWISHRDEGFEELIPFDAEKKYDSSAQSVFLTCSNGSQTNRDAWSYNFSRMQLGRQMKRMIGYYNDQLENIPPGMVAEDHVSMDETQIKWSSSLLSYATRRIEIPYDETETRLSLYRPFAKQFMHFNERVVHRPYQLPKLFPTHKHENLLICVSGIGMPKDFSVVITDVLPDVQLMPNGQCFPLYYYDKSEQTEQMNLFDTGEEYTRRDGISDFILERVRELCGSKVTKRDIFYYVYGILHSEEYRAKYAVNLKKSLPRLPLPEEPKLFWAFSKAGEKLAELHLNYETLPPWKELKEDSPKAKPSYRVTKMRFAKEGKEENKTAIVYNDDVTVWNIPLEAYDYVVNGKSAIEWIMERYAVTTHKESGIVNDPNLWCDEHNQPRYIIDLLKRIVTLSIETMKIVKTLPKLGL